MNATFKSRRKDFACMPHVVGGKWDGETWITLSKLIVKLPDGKIVVIPVGFVTNFGSIPRALRGMLNSMGKSLRAFVLHDWLYSKDKYSYKQRECDRFLYDLGREDGEGWWASQSINKGLAVGGWTCYKKSNARSSRPSKRTLKYIANSNNYKLEKLIT